MFLRKIVLIDSVVIATATPRARRKAFLDGDPMPKVVSVAALRRQRQADEAVADAEKTYGVRVTG